MRVHGFVFLAASLAACAERPLNVPDIELAWERGTCLYGFPSDIDTVVDFLDEAGDYEHWQLLYAEPAEGVERRHWQVELGHRVVDPVRYPNGQGPLELAYADRWEALDAEGCGLSLFRGQSLNGGVWNGNYLRERPASIREKVGTFPQPDGSSAPYRVELLPRFARVGHSYEDCVRLEVDDEVSVGSDYVFESDFWLAQLRTKSHRRRSDVYCAHAGLVERQVDIRHTTQLDRSF